jgi:protein TonB
MAVSYENLPSAASPPLNGDLVHARDPLTNPGPLDATLPPTPIRELLAASGATVYVLAHDAGLVATIRRAAEQHPLYVVETWPELLQAVESERCGIALLDAAVLGPRVAECVAKLAGFADRLVTLVAADRAAAHQYVGLLSDGKIHRLLIKPTAAGAVRLLIESATARRLQLREESANDSHHAAPAASSTRATKRWIAAGAIGAAVLIGVAIAGSRAGWWDRAAPPEAAAPAAAVAAPVESVPTLEERLAAIRAKAELALQEGRLAEPFGDNALDHYRAILALAPADQAARDGVTSVVETLFTRAEEGLLAESLEVTAAALDHVRSVDPSSSRLAFLDAQLARALAALAVAPPAPAPVRPAPAAAPTELDSTLSLATARLRRGQLLTPPGDSARAYFDRAVELAPNDSRVAALRTDLAAALTAAGRLLSAADVGGATNLAGAARELGVDSPDLVALEAELAAARALVEGEQRAARLETARARVQSGALFAPAGDSALDHLLGLQAVAPGLAGLAETWEAFRPAAVLAVQGAIDRGEWAAADTQLAALARAPGGPAAAAPLQAELAARRLQATYLTTPAPASVLRLVSAAPAVYPPDALEREVQGWVDLEFVADRDGRPRNLVVLQASPPGRFDAAALDAVEQYRYAPFEQEGRVYERLVRLRVRFQVQQVQ